jgi:carboxypeptidase Taq
MSRAMRELREQLAVIHDLGRAAALLAWDERTMMPATGAESRAEQLATLAAVRHRMFASDEIGRLIESARSEAEGLDPESEPASLIRVVRRDWEKARRVPAELRAELARAAALGEAAWRDARQLSDFALLRPHLEHNVDLARRFAEHYEGFEHFTHPYDPLLDEYEPGMPTEEMRAMLEALRDGLAPLIAVATERVDTVDDSCLHGDFPEPAQRKLVRGLVSDLPLEPRSWRLDVTAHPFASGIAPRDIRLTTRYDERFISTALFGALHEAGHGLYAAGVDPELARSPLGSLRSLGMHESQSRMWENWVGRGLAYVARLLPRLRAAFPGRFDSVEAHELYRAVNRVQPSLIRIEADELTYNLHILVRFELELAIFEGRLTVAELPEAWGDLTRRYLGVEVPDDAHGVLQDVHWATGSFGYFPTYSLGNVIAGQLWEAAMRAVPDLEERIAIGELAPLGEWLRENVHRHGRKLDANTIVERATGAPTEVGPYLRHLGDKFGEIYGAPLSPEASLPR